MVHTFVFARRSIVAAAPNEHVKNSTGAPSGALAGPRREPGHLPRRGIPQLLQQALECRPVRSHLPHRHRPVARPRVRARRGKHRAPCFRILTLRGWGWICPCGSSLVRPVGLCVGGRIRFSFRGRDYPPPSTYKAELLLQCLGGNKRTSKSGGPCAFGRDA